jgi:hypothetical protein
MARLKPWSFGTEKRLPDQPPGAYNQFLIGLLAAVMISYDAKISNRISGLGAIPDI